MNFIHCVLLVRKQKTVGEKRKEEEEEAWALQKTQQEMKLTMQQWERNLSSRNKLRPQQQDSERKEMATQKCKQRVGKLEQNTDEEPHERGLLDHRPWCIMQCDRAGKICLNEEVQVSVLPRAPPPPVFCGCLVDSFLLRKYPVCRENI